MTTQALSENTPRGRWNTAFFLGELRRSWANCLLYGLVYFFFMVIPMLGEYSRYLRNDFYSRTSDFTYSDIPFELYAVFALSISVWAGISAMQYLHKRTSVYHFHSMPIRREGIFFVKTAVAFADIVIALLPNLAALCAIFALVEIPLMTVVYIALYCLLAFTVGYSFCVLIGSFCGTGSFHFVLTGILGFIGPAFLGAVYLIADSVVSYLRVDHLIDTRYLFGYSSPFVYLIAQLDRFTLLPVGAWIALALFSIVCFVGALLILRIRPTEGAETPVIFSPVAEILKYIVMWLAAVFLGYFFGEIFSDVVFWRIFGYFCGGILSFMLMNVLLARSARKMFRGLGGLLIFYIALALSLGGLTAWYSYQDDHPFSLETTHTISVSPSLQTSDYFALEDPAVIAAGHAFLDAYFARRTDGPVDEGIVYVTTAEEKDYVVYHLDSRSIYITQTNRLGFRRTWRIHLDLYPELDVLTTELMRAIAESERFAERYVALFDGIQNRFYATQTTVEYVDGGYYYTESLKHKDSAEALALIEEIKAEARAQICFDFFQQRRVGECGTRINDVWYDIPVFESQHKLIEAIGLYADDNSLERDYEDFLKYRAEELIVIRNNPDGSHDIVPIEKNDEKTLRALFDSSAIRYGYGQPYFLTRLSRTYSVATPGSYALFTFVDGKVPQFVIDLFDEKN